MTSILVAGAGISGLSVTLALLNRGYRVTLLERGEVGKESSWAGGGILSPLLPWDYSEALTELARYSIALYTDWIDTIEAQSGCNTEFWRCGMEISGINDPAKALTWCKTHATHVQVNPDLPNNIFLPDVAQVRNPRLVEALRLAVLGAGGIIRTHNTFECISHHSGRVTAAHTSSGSYTADQFVIATGAWSGLPIPHLPGAPNIRPIRGQMLLYKLRPGTLETILYRDGLYLIPRRDGHILAGSTLENAGFSNTTDEATLRQLHLAASALLPVLASCQPIRHWAGLRPGAPDNMPIIGRHPEFENVFINTGQYRYGVTLAPASANILADLMEDKVPALNATAFSWQKALNRNWTLSL